MSLNLEEFGYSTVEGPFVTNSDDGVIGSRDVKQDGADARHGMFFSDNGNILSQAVREVLSCDHWLLRIFHLVFVGDFATTRFRKVLLKPPNHSYENRKKIVHTHGHVKVDSIKVLHVRCVVINACRFRKHFKRLAVSPFQKRLPLLALLFPPAVSILFTRSPESSFSSST